MIYLTDGSFEGILTAVFEAYANKVEPEAIISKDVFQTSLLSEVKEVDTDIEKSDRVYKAIVEKIAEEAMETLYRAYLTEDPDVGTYIYRYIKIGLKIGRKTVSYLQNPDILKVHDLSHKVIAEMHLFLGILRFKKLKNGIFYAHIEPDNNITMLISSHFVDRLSDQPWIIHDARRDVYALYDTNQVVFSREHIAIPEDGLDEQFELLWKRYFKTIAIESRKNLRAQKQFMPRRYWKNLVEKQG
ncbi:MAG: TIGR03915 family putative DNA repair protein [Clostridia bacterium]|nr:TIGR03915 family putative DNA repair protein [Clostridia bacterium]